MVSRGIQRYLTEIFPGDSIRYDEPLNTYNSFRVGGNADCVVTVSTQDQLKKLLTFLRKTDNDFIVLGRGTNVLISDRGFPGVVIRMGAGMSRIHCEGNRIYAQAGATLPQIAARAYENSLTGLEFASGIPGTVGGGVLMNAGAYGGEMSQVVESVTVMDGEGEFMDLENSTMQFGYRTSAIKNRSFVVTEAAFILKPGEKDRIAAKMREQDAQRRAKQPLDMPSAGSSFKRPEGHYAGKLIMDAGLAGYQLGGARISEKHCGFIVNAGGATADDIARLMKLVQDKVRSQFHVHLEPEIIFLGEFEEKPYIYQ